MQLKAQIVRRTHIYSSKIETLLHYCYSYTSGSLHLSTVVSIELGSLEMVCSIYLKSQRPSEALNRVSPSSFFSSNVHVCINVSLNVRCRSVWHLENIN